MIEAESFIARYEGSIDQLSLRKRLRIRHEELHGQVPLETPWCSSSNRNGEQLPRPSWAKNFPLLANVPIGIGFAVAACMLLMGD